MENLLKLLIKKVFHQILNGKVNDNKIYIEKINNIEKDLNK